MSLRKVDNKGNETVLQNVYVNLCFKVWISYFTGNLEYNVLDECSLSKLPIMDTVKSYANSFKFSEQWNFPNTSERFIADKNEVSPQQFF